MRRFALFFFLLCFCAAPFSAFGGGDEIELSDGVRIETVRGRLARRLTDCGGIGAVLKQA